MCVCRFLSLENPRHSIKKKCQIKRQNTPWINAFRWWWNLIRLIMQIYKFNFYWENYKVMLRYDGCRKCRVASHEIFVTCRFQSPLCRSDAHTRRHNYKNSSHQSDKHWWQSPACLALALAVSLSQSTKSSLFFFNTKNWPKTTYA